MKGGHSYDLALLDGDMVEYGTVELGRFVDDDAARRGVEAALAELADSSTALARQLADAERVVLRRMVAVADVVKRATAAKWLPEDP